jgi:hypothetical protein
MSAVIVMMQLANRIESFMVPVGLLLDNGFFFGLGYVGLLDKSFLAGAVTEV